MENLLMKDLHLKILFHLERKTGRSKGSGIGGYIMNQVVLHHNGTLEMVTVDPNDMLAVKLNTIVNTGVHFRIKLPIVK